jgi:hypothetical protein
MTPLFVMSNDVFVLSLLAISGLSLIILLLGGLGGGGGSSSRRFKSNEEALAYEAQRHAEWERYEEQLRTEHDEMMDSFHRWMEENWPKLLSSLRQLGSRESQP